MNHLRTIAGSRLLPALFGLAALLCACGDGGRGADTGVKRFTLEDFATVDLSQVADSVTSDCDVVGVVKELRLVNDSIIALSLLRAIDNVVLYNLRSGESQVACRKGLGPLELSSVGSLSVSADGRLMMMGGYDGKVLAARWNDASNTASVEAAMSSDALYMKGVSVDSGRFVTFASPDYASRMLLLDSAGNVVDSLGLFPKAELPDSARADNVMFQARMSYSPAARRVMVANGLWNEIEISDIDGGGETVLCGPIFPDLKVMRFGNEEYYGFSVKPLWLIFQGAASGDEGFAVGYVGIKPEKDADFHRGISQILEFDWDGTPRRRFVLSSEAITFDIDYANGVLYTVEDRPDPTLMRYKLK